MTDIVYNASLALGKWAVRSKLSDFYEELLENLHMNISISHFLQVRSDLCIRRGRRDEAVVYQLMLRRMEEGGSLSHAGTGVLPASNLIMIQAGEHVAKIVSGVESASFANRSMVQMRALVARNLMFPVVLGFAVLGLMALFGSYVIPQFLFIAPIQKMGVSYRVAYALTQFFIAHWLFVVPAILAGIGWIVWSVGHVTGPARRYLDRIPPWSIVRQYVSAALMINLSGLLRSNVTLQDAVSLLLRDASAYERFHLRTIQARLNAGQSLTTALDTGLIPDEIVDRLVSFELAGSNKLEDVIRRIGFENIERSLRVVERNVQFIAGMMKIGVGAMLGWLAYDTLSLGQVISAMAKSGAG